MKTKTQAPTDPRQAEAVKLMVEAQRLLDKIVNLVEPTATTELEPVGSIGISTFDPKDERTRELNHIMGRIGEIRVTYFGKPDPKNYKVRPWELIDAAKAYLKATKAKPCDPETKPCHCEDCAFRAAISNAEVR